MNGARLVGTTTMGKGTIQSSPQRLSDGSAVSITVAKLLCGDGTSFDGTGLSVDVERALSADEANSYLDYTPTTDPQVQRAVSAAQQLSGTTTVAGANDSASSAAASEPPPSGREAFPCGKADRLPELVRSRQKAPSPRGLAMPSGIDWGSDLPPIVPMTPKAAAYPATAFF